MRELVAHLLRIRFLRSVAVMLSLCLFAIALAAELPPFRKGMWEFHRTVDAQDSSAKPTTMTNKKCTDPSADMKRMNEMLSKQGCKFSATTVKANVYSFSAECKMQGASGQSQSTITVESDSAYTVLVTGSGGGRSTKEFLVAKRVGDC
jgi:ABC-type transport system involved in cytochrome bd biosynthesis fused ATPase/permease subunit